MRIRMFDDEGKTTGTFEAQIRTGVCEDCEVEGPVYVWTGAGGIVYYACGDCLEGDVFATLVNVAEPAGANFDFDAPETKQAVPAFGSLGRRHGPLVERFVKPAVWPGAANVTMDEETYGRPDNSADEQMGQGPWPGVERSIRNKATWLRKRSEHVCRGWDQCEPLHCEGCGLKASGDTEIFIQDIHYGHVTECFPCAVTVLFANKS